MAKVYTGDAQRGGDTLHTTEQVELTQPGEGPAVAVEEQRESGRLLECWGGRCGLVVLIIGEGHKERQQD